MQERLAGLRTDLDSFSDAEAYALMLSGYRMADAELPAAYQRSIISKRNVKTGHSSAFNRLLIANWIRTKNTKDC